MAGRQTEKVVLRIANYLRMAIDYCLDCKSNNIIADSQIPICRKAWKRGIRLWRRFFAPPLVSEVSLQFGHARGKTTLSCFLTSSRRFTTPMAYAQMRTPFCDSASHRGRFKSSRTSAKEIKKQPSFLGSVVLLFGAGRGIRTPVPFGQTVFKTASL